MRAANSHRTFRSWASSAGSRAWRGQAVANHKPFQRFHSPEMPRSKSRRRASRATVCASATRPSSAAGHRGPSSSPRAGSRRRTAGARPAGSAGIRCRKSPTQPTPPTASGCVRRPERARRHRSPYRITGAPSDRPGRAISPAPDRGVHTHAMILPRRRYPPARIVTNTTDFANTRFGDVHAPARQRTHVEPLTEAPSGMRHATDVEALIVVRSHWASNTALRPNPARSHGRIEANIARLEGLNVDTMLAGFRELRASKRTLATSRWPFWWQAKHPTTQTSTRRNGSNFWWQGNRHSNRSWDCRRITGSSWRNRARITFPRKRPSS